LPRDTRLDFVTPVTEGEFPALPKKIAALARKAPREKIPCPQRQGIYRKPLE